ncbi:aspartate ammonia-lyase [Patescibacteria group bacterium]
MSSQKFRKEKDSMGSMKVPKDAYYGAFTVRAHNNFNISGITAPKAFRMALGIVKFAAVKTNGKLGLIKKNYVQAIEKACQEFIDGQFDPEFSLDVFQAGAGTSYNMNANEIIANRANEILKGKKGEYKYVHPNNHVNIGQSTNDVIPTSSRVATLLCLPPLLEQIKELEKNFIKHSQKYKNLLKVGRTHLQDAVPITMGQELESYQQALEKSRNQIEKQSQDLTILGIGGTAVGTGINSHKNYKKTIVENISKITSIKFKSGKNLTEMANNMNAFMNFSASLRSLATNIINISHDLMLMNTGPKAGLSEIDLPPVQPGSSIMPGKINPSICECALMIAFQVLGNDKTIEAACQRSHFELNVFCPIIMFNLVQSMEILTNGLKMLNQLCVKDMKINQNRIEELFDNSLCTGTALAPKLGYIETSDIIKAALKKGKTIKQEVLDRKLLSKKELDELLSPKNTTQPS